MRGGRSIVATLRRGRTGVSADKSSAGSGLKGRGADMVQHQGSLRKDGAGAGANGTPLPREQVGPEQGTSRPGTVGIGLASISVAGSNNLRSESKPRRGPATPETT